MATQTLPSVLETFFQQLRQAEKRALFLDYDGTIAPFTAARRRAYPYPTVEGLIDCIQGTTATRVVLVSGRGARDLAELLRLQIRPEIWGTHGRERLLPDGTYEVTASDPLALRALAEADAWMETQGWGDRMEPKAGATALHWRGLPQEKAEEMSERLREGLADLCHQAGLRLRDFAGGVEIDVGGVNKGAAVDTVLAEMGAGAVAAYLGDDLSDEDAFRAIRGRGLSVLVRPAPRPTAAEAWLVPPHEVSQFLNEWLLVSGGEL